MPYIHDFSITVLGYAENRYREPTSYLHQIVVAGYMYDQVWQKLATYPDNLELKIESRHMLRSIQLDMSMLRNTMNLYMRDNHTLEQGIYIRIYQDFAKLIHEKANELDFRLSKDINDMDS